MENLKVMEQLKDDRARAAAVERLMQLVPDIVFSEWKQYDEWDEWIEEQAKIKPRQNVFVLVGPTGQGRRSS